jgi:hypothetical protein
VLPVQTQVFSPAFSRNSLIQPDPNHLVAAISLNHAVNDADTADWDGLPCRRSWVRVPSSALQGSCKSAALVVFPANGVQARGKVRPPFAFRNDVRSRFDLSSVVRCLWKPRARTTRNSTKIARRLSSSERRQTVVDLPGGKPPSASTEGHLCLPEERASCERSRINSPSARSPGCPSVCGNDAPMTVKPSAAPGSAGSGRGGGRGSA